MFRVCMYLWITLVTIRLGTFAISIAHKDRAFLSRMSILLRIIFFQVLVCGSSRLYNFERIMLLAIKEINIQALEKKGIVFFLKIKDKFKVESNVNKIWVCADNKHIE